MRAFEEKEFFATQAKMIVRKNYDDHREIGSDGCPIYDPLYERKRAEAEDAAFDTAWDSLN